MKTPLTIADLENGGRGSRAMGCRQWLEPGKGKEQNLFLFLVPPESNTALKTPLF